MTETVVQVPGPMVLVPGRSLDAQLDARAGSDGIPRDPCAVAADLNGRTDGVPATLSPPRGNYGPGLVLYPAGYVVKVSPSRQRDFCFVNSVHALGMRNHRELADGFVRIKPASWVVAQEPRQVPTGADTAWAAIIRAWERRTGVDFTSEAASASTAHQAAFLTAIDELVDAGEALDIEKHQGHAGFPFRDVTATGGRRDGTRSAYDFHLVGQAPEVNAYVHVRGATRQRGQVTRIDGATATVRFDDPVDWSALSRQGALQPTPNSTVYRRQREAVDRLRTGRTAGSGLLGALVDHRPRRFTRSSALPSEALDPEQLAAFQGALVVPDLLAVLGPPGTGKTRTIVEITRACAETSPPQRVLVTSHTHRAVDNVVARLPSSLVVIRVGHEDRVTRDGRPFLLAQQASDLRQEILGRTQQRIADHEGVGQAEQWAPELHRRADALGAAVRTMEARQADFDAVLHNIDEAARRRFAEATAEVAALEREIEEGGTTAEQLAARAERSRFAFLAKRRRTRLAGMVAKLTDLNFERGALTEELKTLHDGMTARWADTPAVMSATSAFRASHRECRALMPPALEAVRFVHALVARVGASLGCPHLSDVPDPDRGSVIQITREIIDFTTWITGALPTLRARSDLLTAWRDDAAKESTQLYPELIRYADVIAATCSGTATVDELGDIDVDLTIIDEAGQIGLPDALVPLVRAKRAVLVGDDRQLPPFLEHDVKQWGEEKADPQVLSLLTKSALELLVDDLPPANIVQLTRQRRMPPDVCAFISARFYRGLLTTEGEHPYHDQVFTRPMAFVETSYLPEQARRERTGGPREAWNVTGTSNPAEAELLAELAAFYHRGGADWAVIVPYRAQVALVTEKLAERLRDIDTVRHNVGTVDSFQGGERDVILYGFTRSNRQGEVGFLRELRRINVALSRVRRQLVMVGDATTLSEARDPGFRELAEALREHLKQRGEVREYHEVLSLVRKLADHGGEG